jgi:hypothetical protein
MIPKGSSAKELCIGHLLAKMLEFLKILFRLFRGEGSYLKAIRFNYGQFQLQRHCYEFTNTVSRKEERMIAKKLLLNSTLQKTYPSYFLALHRERNLN